MGEKMNTTTNALNWFEIPALDMPRAVAFYERIFEIQLQQMDMMGMKMAMFPPTGEGGSVGGALVQSNMHVPSKTGTYVYLNANPNLQDVLSRAESLGSKVVLPKTAIGEDHGFMAFVEDSEGNIIGLHSNN